MSRTRKIFMRQKKHSCGRCKIAATVTFFLWKEQIVYQQNSCRMNNIFLLLKKLLSKIQTLCYKTEILITGTKHCKQIPLIWTIFEFRNHAVLDEIISQISGWHETESFIPPSLTIPPQEAALGFWLGWGNYFSPLLRMFCQVW